MLVSGTWCTMLKVTSPGGWAWMTLRSFGRILYSARWNGYSDEGRCGPTMVPSALTHMMSAGVREPLSMPAGVIHMSPLSSMMDKFPPEVVVIFRR